MYYCIYSKDTFPRRKFGKLELRSLLYCLVDNFKRIGPRMHVHKVKALVCFNSSISCKSKSDTTKNRSFWFFRTRFFLIIFSSPNASNSINLIHLNDRVIDWSLQLDSVCTTNSSTPEFHTVSLLFNWQTGWDLINIKYG